VKKFRFDDLFRRIDSGSYGETRALFLRCLGVVYFFAFVSLWTQIIPLIGSDGLLPVGGFLREAREHLTGISRYHVLPTLSWIDDSDTFLQAQCALGVLLSISLIVGYMPAVSCLVLWVLWLSLTVAGQDFLAFQWENLLLETGFLAIFLAHWRTKLKAAEPVSGRVLWLLRWLLFRLMFLSGVVKLLSGDPAWRNFTALFYHYETQPLPTIIGWFVYQMPSWAHVATTGLMYIIELLVPFLIFLPRRFRIAAFIPLVGFQLAIALTGNYGYFNFLTIVLCILLLDDEALQRLRLVRQKTDVNPDQRGMGRAHLILARFRSGSIAVVSALVLIITAVQFTSILARKQQWGRSVRALYQVVQPFRSINTYGLFAVMTKTRREIVIEGSNDLQNWKAYEFRYKPGDLRRAPRFIAPFQPRLDWQMWFAALGSYEQNRWLTTLCMRLLQGNSNALSLLKSNPFPDAPPTYLRAMIYEYEFTDWASMRSAGEWWRRGEPAIYMPPVAIQTAGEPER
jgi:hypothetical protein